jgi:hypothetical protein
VAVGAGAGARARGVGPGAAREARGLRPVQGVGAVRAGLAG